jgi:hypothetical protein
MALPVLAIQTVLSNASKVMLLGDVEPELPGDLEKKLVPSRVSGRAGKTRAKKDSASTPFKTLRPALNEELSIHASTLGK